MGEKMYMAYTKPGKGVYKCTMCPYVIEITDDDQELEACPICGVEQYIKIG